MTTDPAIADPRARLDQLIRSQGDDYASMSRFLGKNPAYVQQFIKRGTPRRLAEDDRRKLAAYYRISETELGGPVPAAQSRVPRDGKAGLVRIPQLQVAASAGPGALAEEDRLDGNMGFGPEWLKKLSVDPAKLSIIRVDGDSMDPTLCDGDDIMVDHRAAELPLRDGIYVLRMDDVLLVKRIALRPGGRLSIRSDNSQYPDWEDVEAADTRIIGRVIWTGRRL
ncbi:Phage repressor protein C, contains Cro/C1-type HTH and peptisase s24 domains [Parasphingorhabdus marina DSM 22363]|uniref:Phage repressor protein C, contains Cro/C1-type HTH and peptisase s24 domains n=1 Tax=Parasphingorhabdus marina DSM 22363 TaxID=1123272 RepID=A0A1N6CM84_9SPHN|nr:S24 family peptidase [Parasphingorhabdus marina]SIN59671.1 Phage repressor protein C, contains Cro/C1-type HTH and peptisase s24 domains [Parasphingorhabdus marina DSM 22363]